MPVILSSREAACRRTHAPSALRQVSQDGDLLPDLAAEIGAEVFDVAGGGDDDVVVALAGKP